MPRQLNIHEILTKCSNLTGVEDKINFLRQNYNEGLIAVLRCLFNPNVKFCIKEIPNYKKSKVPEDFGISNLAFQIHKLYLFEENHPRKSKNLSQEKIENLFIQMIETLDQKEAYILENMIMKRKEKYPFLSLELLNQAFPGKII